MPNDKLVTNILSKHILTYCIFSCALYSVKKLGSAFSGHSKIQVLHHLGQDTSVGKRMKLFYICKYTFQHSCHVTLEGEKENVADSRLSLKLYFVHVIKQSWLLFLHLTIYMLVTFDLLYLHNIFISLWILTINPISQYKTFYLKLEISLKLFLN